MLCKKCGTNVIDGIKYCPNCGSNIDENQLVQPTNNSFENDNLSVNNIYEQPVNNVQPYVNEISSQPVNNVPPVIPMNNSSISTNNDKKGNSGLTLVIASIVVALVACGGIIWWSTNKNKGSNLGDNTSKVVNPDNKVSNEIYITSNVNSNIESNITSNVVSNIVSNPTSNIVSNTTSNVVSNVTSNVVSNTTSNVVSNVTSNVVSNAASNVATNANYYGTKFAGYTLQVPKTYTVVSASTSQLQLMGTNASDVAIIGIQDGQYDTIKSNLSQVNTYVKQKGYTLNKNAVVKNYNGVEFITVEISQGNQTMVLAYSKLSASKVFMIVIANTSGKADYEKLNTFAYTVKTIKVS